MTRGTTVVDGPATVVDDGISSNYERFEGGDGGRHNLGQVTHPTTALQIANGTSVSPKDTGDVPPHDTGSAPALGFDAASGFHTLAGMLVNDERFQRFIIVLIVLNGIVMGVETFDFVTDNPEVVVVFERIDRSFLIIFTIELFFQFVYHGMHLFSDGWLVFDFAVVFLSWAFASLQIIRAFRIFRALRLMTRIKELKNLVKVLLGVIPRMFAIGVLMLLLFYIFAVMFTQLFKTLYDDGYTSGNYFSRIDITFLTLFQIMTLDSWSMITHEVMKAYSWAWFPFVTFVMMSSFVVINLVIGVICDAVASAASTEYDAKLQQIEAIASADSNDRERLESKVDDLAYSLRMLMESQRQLHQELQQLKSKHD